MVRKMILLLGLAWLLPAAGAARAEDIIAGQFYGSGVHRYFAGDLRAAHTEFTAAIQAGREDPRPYYYRALANLRLGRQREALADFQMGADLEAADINGSFQVSKALERIQGRPRLQLERYRVQARAIAQQRQEQQRRDRYAAARRSEIERVQRASAEQDDPRTRAARPEAPDPFDDDAPATLPAGRADPFADAPPAEPQPAARGAGRADAFDPPPEAPATAPGDPFGSPPPAAERPLEDATPPFGAPATPAPPADAGADPFGAPSIERTTPAEQPAPADSDPFGAAATSPAPAATPAATPADSTDPFGAPSSPPATGADTASDPFGGPANSAAPTNPAAPIEPAASSDTSADGENPFGGAPTANNAAAPAVGNSTSQAGGATGGLFRALGRAVGVDAARGTAESVMNALPVGRSGPSSNMLNGSGPQRTAPLGAPPAAGRIQPGAVPAQGTDPFGEPAPAADAAADPFGQPAATGQDVDPFGAPPGNSPQAPAAGDNPFQDDPVQPGTPPADPFGGAR